MSKKVRMLGLDLDGTLFDNKKQMSGRDEDRIREVIRRGVIVVPITGRPKSGISDKIQELFRNSYMITSNGAVTTDIKEGLDIDNICLHHETVSEIIEIVMELNENVQIEIFSEGIGYVQEHHLKAIREKYRGTSLESYIHTTRSSVNDIRSFAQSRKNSIAEISVMTESIEQKEELKNALNRFGTIKMTSSVQTDLEINSIYAGKGNALLNLAKRFGITGPEIMACGDSGNDIEMIRFAGIGVAMGNADENVRNAADYVTLTNEESGVAHAIERFILN